LASGRVASWYAATMNSQPTANSVLTVCLTSGGRFNRHLRLRCARDARAPLVASLAASVPVWNFGGWHGSRGWCANGQCALPAGVLFATFRYAAPARCGAGCQMCARLTICLKRPAATEHGPPRAEPERKARVPGGPANAMRLGLWSADYRRFGSGSPSRVRFLRLRLRARTDLIRFF
jgi:hypothetical protein